MRRREVVNLLELGIEHRPESRELTGSDVTAIAEHLADVVREIVDRQLEEAARRGAAVMLGEGWQG